MLGWVRRVLIGLVHRSAADRDLDDELQATVRVLEQERIRQGAAPHEARRQAVLELGGVEQVKEQVRATRALAFVDTVFADLRHGARMLRRSPGFAAVAVLTVALGIGANTAIFSVVESVLLEPLPFPEPERLVELGESRLAQGWARAGFSHPNFWDVHDRNHSFEALGALSPSALNLTEGEYPERLSAGAVSVGFLRALRVKPVLGRLFLPGDDQSGHDNQLVVLGHSLWTGRFGSDQTIVGRSLTLDGKRHTVIGVLPRGEPFLSDFQVFVPLVRRGDANRDSFELGVVGRLRPGLSVEGARADLETICRQLAEQYPDADKGMGIAIGTADAWVASDSLRRSLWLLMGAVGLLLLVACVNLASLLLAKSAGRARELAMRGALGAARGRLVRQVLTETVLVCALGAVVGLGLATLLMHLLRTAGISGIPRISEIGLDGQVLGFTMVAALVSGLLAGLVPAFKTSRADLVSAMRQGERGTAGHRQTSRVRSALVATEVALSLALLVGAGLLARSFNEVLRTERGFQTDRRLVVEVNLPRSYDEPIAAGTTTAMSGRGPLTRGAQFIAEFTSRMESIPQVVSAAAVNVRPLGGGDTGMGFGAAGGAGPAGEKVPWASWRMVTRDYFRTMGIPLLRGRLFTVHDRIGDPWRVIVSQRLANLVWPGQDPIGRHLDLWKGQNARPAEVIGVVGDMRERQLTSDPTLAVYIPYYGADWSPVHFVVHTTAPPEAFVTTLRSALASLDPNLPLYNIQTLSDLVDESVASRRLIMLLLAGFAVTALLLALAGVYGVLSHAVAARTSEIGVRLTLGASRSSVLRLVLMQGMRPVLAGVAVGLAAALALSGLMAGLLFGVTRADVPTYAVVAIGLTLAALLSCCIPVLQALRVNVVTALRQE
jgi:putative ABC transport system permease protein